MKNLIEKTIAEIQEKKIQPSSRSYFSLRNLAFWSASFLTLIFSSFAVSLILFLTFDLDWDIYEHLNDSWLENILIAIPHLWIFFLVIFAALSYFLFKKTKKSYRRSFALIILIIFISSLIGGTTLYASGLSEKLNIIFAENIPQYNDLIHSKEDQWSQADNGLLSGTIQSLNENALTITDFNQENWTVYINDNTNVKGRVNLSENEVIKIIGEKISNREFQAEEIRPWGKGKR